MSFRHSSDSPIAEGRYLIASVVILVLTAVLDMRLWYLQVYQGDYYSKVSENNRMRRIEIPAARGRIFDKDGRIILGNRPFYDLVYIPQYVKKPEQTLKVLGNLLHIPYANLDKVLKASRGRPKFLPVVLKRNLSTHEVSIIESNKIFLPGVEVNVAPRRDYNQDIPAHVVGYMGEISKEALQRMNKENPDNPYALGELVGKQGLEARWEYYLRGKRGHKFIQVDAFGRQNRVFEKEGWELPVTPAQPGAELTLTLDMDLQKVAKLAFQGKYGAIVALNPQNGEILVMLSSPDYDPTMYQESLSVEKWQSLISDPYNPLFDKTTGGSFPPGSVYKSVVALAGLQEGVINNKTSFFCSGAFDLGKDVFHCHQRRGHGRIDLIRALSGSCDVFFFHVGMELGVDRIAKYAKALGLGSILDVGLNKEDSGLIPTTAWKKSTTGSGWNRGDIPSMSIGQGANLLTPIQIASLYSTISNGGNVWRPYIVKKVTHPDGSLVLQQEPHLIRKATEISPQNFDIVKQALMEVVMSPTGTGRSARVPGHIVAGKTSSVQVVNLKKNRNREMVVSMKWQEHAVFAAFSPVENPEIVVAVFSENDQVGGGGAAAAPVVQKIIAAYWAKKEHPESFSPNMFAPSTPTSAPKPSPVAPVAPKPSPVAPAPEGGIKPHDVPATSVSTEPSPSTTPSTPETQDVHTTAP